jgi:outer membrane receptor protein involved in Fe transport
VQITSVAVGNPLLDPEKADTITFGAIYRPGWLEGLQVSVDYYDIDVQDAIGTLGIQRVVSDCFAGVTELCQYVERDPSSQVIGRVRNPYLNVAQTAVRGVDYEAQYTLRPDFFADSLETLNFRVFVSNLLERSNVATTGAARVELAGGFSGGTPGGGGAAPVLYPDWKGTATLGYTVGAWTYQISEEWISRSKIATEWVQGRDVDDNWLPNYLNTNARIGYRHDSDSGASWDLSLFITNLLDKHPMVIPSYSSRTGSQTVSNNYDAYGRRYDVAFRYSF